MPTCSGEGYGERLARKFACQENDRKADAPRPADGAILRIRAQDPLIADQLAINYRKSDISPRQKAMLDFAVKVSQSAHLVGDDDMELLKRHGFDEEDVWNIAAIAAFFGLSNRVANVTNMRPNPEFYSMGRG